jgi:hypothetical protein
MSIGYLYDARDENGLVHRIKWNENRREYGKFMCDQDFTWQNVDGTRVPDLGGRWVAPTRVATPVVHDTPVTCLACLVYVPGKDDQ